MRIITTVFLCAIAVSTSMLSYTIYYIYQQIVYNTMEKEFCLAPSDDYTIKF